MFLLFLNAYPLGSTVHYGYLLVYFVTYFFVYTYGFFFLLLFIAIYSLVDVDVAVGDDFFFTLLFASPTFTLLLLATLSPLSLTTPSPSPFFLPTTLSRIPLTSSYDNWNIVLFFIYNENFYTNNFACY